MNVEESRKWLRGAAGEAIVNLAQRNEKVAVVSANVMASCRVSASVELFPERAFNVGIAEQDMISFAAGLAREGFLPYACTFAPFMSMRACEQVRTDVAYNRLNVRMIAPYAGVSGGISGATHWTVEDCAIMTGIPGITILEPCDYVQTQKMIEASEFFEGPIYMRIGIEPASVIYSEDYNYEIGKASVLNDGNDGAYICSGVTVKYAMEAVKQLKEEQDIDIMVIDMHTIKPIDRQAVCLAARTQNVVVAQDHNVMGGLGFAVAAVIAEAGFGIHFKMVGLPDRFVPMAHAPFLYHKYGLDADGLRGAMLEVMNR